MTDDPKPPEPEPEPGPVPDLAALEKAVLADQARERGPLARLRALPTFARAAVLLLVVAVEVVLFLALVPRRDLASYPTVRFVSILAIYAVVIGAAAWISLRPLYLPPIRPAVERTIVGVGLAAPFALAALPELPTHPITASHYDPVRQGLMCFLEGTVVGAIATAAAWLVDRQGHGLLAAAFLAAIVGGLTGATALHVECPVNDRLHLALGHASVPVVMLGAYGLFRRRPRVTSS